MNVKIAVAIKWKFTNGYCGKTENVVKKYKGCLKNVCLSFQTAFEYCAIAGAVRTSGGQ